MVWRGYNTMKNVYKDFSRYQFDVMIGFRFSFNPQTRDYTFRFDNEDHSYKETYGMVQVCWKNTIKGIIFSYKGIIISHSVDKKMELLFNEKECTLSNCQDKGGCKKTDNV